MASPLNRILDWFRSGYPQGMPQQDYVVLLGVLARKLTASEVDWVAKELAHNGLIDATDEQIADTIHEAMLTPPREVDVDRVSNHLHLAQWVQEIEAQFPDHA